MPGLEGTTLGHYRLQQRLGRGGMSEVYLAYDEQMNREVAIKVVSSTQADYVERFRREAAAIDSLHHEHILPALDYGEQGLWQYLIMPYITHGTLRDRLARGRLTVQEAGEMLTQIADALQFAHDHGIIHRDIKPSNILLRDDHYAYLADFGLAKAMEGASQITQTGSLLGTPEYMAPELADGPATTSSDIYALGILLYQMVTGRVPFTAETPFAVYLKQLRELPRPPAQFNPALTHSVEQVILRALEKNPRRRFQTVQALTQAYTQALNAPMPVPAPSLSDSGEMPPLFELTPKQAPITPSPPPSTPPTEKKLVLPGNPIARSPLEQQRYTAEDAAPLRSLGQVPRSRTARSASSLAASIPARRPSVGLRVRRRRPNRILLASLIGLILFLLITVLVAVAIYNGNLQRRLGGTATVQTDATNRVQTTQTASADATQHVQTQAQATQNARNAQATVLAALPATVTSGTPAFADNLSSNTNGWQVNATCTFMNGSYHVLVAQSNFLQVCGASTNGSSTTVFGNVAIQTDVSLLSGDNAGLILRINGTNETLKERQFYAFEITSQGEFFFRRHDAGTGGNYTDLIQRTQSSAILPGNQKNTLLVIANGNDFKLFINGMFVGEQQDGADGSGQVGFVADTTPATASGEGSFGNLKVFPLL